MTALFPDGLPKIIYGYPVLKEDNDIRYVDWDGKRIPIMTDVVLHVYSRYNSHVFYYIYEEYANYGQPIPGVPLIEKIEYSYYTSLEDAISHAKTEQERLEKGGEYTPIFIVER